jgi:mono/diheme cytochrome c family protein
MSPFWRVALGAGLGGLAIAGIWWFSLSTRTATPLRITVPELSPAAQAGEKAFEKRCAPCHGENAAGAATGPPLVHRVYHPRHHADIVFELAVRRGVQAHHWGFGDMPPQPEVTAAEVADIVQYVRDLQKANGIY